MFRLSVKDVMQHIENEIAPLHYALPGDKNGLEFGSAENEVTNIVVCWSPTLNVIKEAIKVNANLIVAHEWLIYEYLGNKWITKELPKNEKRTNIERVKLLTTHNISVLKYHSNWDFAPGGVADSLGEYLGFKNLIYSFGLARVYEEPQMKLSQLAELVRNKLEIPCLRVIGDPERKVSYIGTAPGGLGQIFTYADEFANTRTDVIIFGEALAYSEIYASEMGYSCIITSHEASEMPGMKKLASLLKRRFPHIEVTFVRSSFFKCSNNAYEPYTLSR